MQLPADRAQVFELAFPEDKYLPISHPKVFYVLPISLNVLLSFGVPVAGVVRGGDTPVAAAMLMPKATMDKDYLSARNKNEVGLAGKIGDVERVAVAHGMGQLSYEHLRCRIFAANGAHTGAALFRRKCFRHLVLFFWLVGLCTTRGNAGWRGLNGQARKYHLSIPEGHQQCSVLFYKTIWDVFPIAL
jgi:hypothetical protein